MKCRFCKREIEDDSKFCSYCGQSPYKENNVDLNDLLDNPERLRYIGRKKICPYPIL